MKFEHVLKIYWSKGFLFTSRLSPYDVSYKDFLKHIGGLGWETKLKLIKRFELNHIQKDRNISLLDLEASTVKSLNILLSQITSVNNQISELVRFHLIRLYLTKTMRGKAQALGKPSRGQRSWSNAWTSYRNNKVLRRFISDTQKILNTVQKVEKIVMKL